MSNTRMPSGRYTESWDAGRLDGESDSEMVSRLVRKPYKDFYKSLLPSENWDVDQFVIAVNTAVEASLHRVVTANKIEIEDIVEKAVARATKNFAQEAPDLILRLRYAACDVDDAMKKMKADIHEIGRIARRAKKIATTKDKRNARS